MAAPGAAAIIGALGLIPGPPNPAPPPIRINFVHLPRLSITTCIRCLHRAVYQFKHIDRPAFLAGGLPLTIFRMNCRYTNINSKKCAKCTSSADHCTQWMEGMLGDWLDFHEILGWAEQTQGVAGVAGNALVSPTLGVGFAWANYPTAAAAVPEATGKLALALDHAVKMHAKEYGLHTGENASKHTQEEKAVYQTAMNSRRAIHATLTAPPALAPPAVVPAVNPLPNGPVAPNRRTFLRLAPQDPGYNVWQMAIQSFFFEIALAAAQDAAANLVDCQNLRDTARYWLKEL
ncbi:hypothetical protein N7466_006673 [Penicillium verhagenii]|uniref:uncharacterized protein n=1 Tax=Penicillium verhagenii TaxID=1562060 RepID=UPI002545AC52|nr:uncharacterized protein N7466_006673 [Penicillium verhagenii]KAJ5927717.1 hypothetical protein N7466_006673 [Penicillium verhagenii]